MTPAQLLLVAGIPALPAVLGFVLAVVRDGSPFTKGFWS
jgi:hypothetical protein